MPEQVQKQVKFNQILKGDELFWGGTFSSVEKTEPKKVYGWIIFQDGRDLRVTLKDEHMFTVLRMEPTEEEKKAQQEEYSTEWIQREIATAPKDVQKAKDALVARLDENWKDCGIDKWQAFAWEKRMAELWNRVAECAQVQEITLLEAAKLIHADELNRFVSNVRFTTGSISKADNLADGVRNEATAKWLDNFKWHVL
jgi:hypothetical protein